MSHITINHPNNISNNFFTTNNTPQNQLFIPSSYTQVDTQPICFVSSKPNRQVTKSAQKQKSSGFKELRQLRTRSFKKKRNLQQTETNFSTSLPQNKTTLDNYSNHTSVQKPKPSNLLKTIQQQKKLIQKMTFHRIRSQRENFENQTKRLENSYNYLLNQVEKNKKKSLEKAERLQRIKDIQQQSKRQKQLFETQRNLFIEERSLQKSRLRQTVIEQKKDKQRKVIDFYNNLHENASIIRFQSNQIQEQILHEQISSIQQKKTKYLQQKSKQKKRFENRQKNLENKRMQAQHEFKMKWLKEFNQSSQARRRYMKRRQVLGRKMERLYEEMTEQHTLQNTIEIKVKKEAKRKNKSELKLARHDMNPQV